MMPRKIVYREGVRVTEPPPAIPEHDLWQVDLPYMCAGLLSYHPSGTVFKAAPILGWAKGKPIEQVIRWVERKGGACRLIDSYRKGDNYDQQG